MKLSNNDLVEFTAWVAGGYTQLDRTCDKTSENKLEKPSVQVNVMFHILNYDEHFKQRWVINFGRNCSEWNIPNHLIWINSMDSEHNLITIW